MQKGDLSLLPQPHSRIVLGFEAALPLTAHAAGRFRRIRKVTINPTADQLNAMLPPSWNAKLRRMSSLP